MGATPADWYPDPSGAPGQRFFDGLQWTEHRTKPHKGSRKTAMWIVIAAVVLLFGG